MSNAAINIRNALTTAQSLDIKIDERRQIRAKLNAVGTTGDSVDVGDMATLSELNRSPDFRLLLDASPPKVTITVVRGTNDVEGADVGAVVNASGLDSASPRLYVTFAAGAAGARDIALFTANFPFAAVLIDAQLLISTVSAGATLTLRSATGGGGNALSGAMSVAALGRVRDAGTGQTAGDGVLVSIAKDSSLVARMSDGQAAGTIILDFARVS